MNLSSLNKHQRRLKTAESTRYKSALFLGIAVNFFGVEDQVSDRSREDKEAENAEADEEQVEIAVVSLSDAIADPWTVMVESKMVKKYLTFLKSTWTRSCCRGSSEKPAAV